ncbi:reverse transcriptase [Daphnia sinensis]|uniref:Reverse transcriptase n=1 Tax=Daphnia sinensis TaxID=1820382 RepID=A0AAD5PTT1_9CRUS|nr:reverse transcriptase [Daphnia sinensis]
MKRQLVAVRSGNDGRSSSARLNDPMEKTLTEIQLRIMDSVRPLLHLKDELGHLGASRNLKRAANTALSLVGNAFADITKRRRLNVLKQTDIRYVSLLEEKDRFSVRESENLFGRHFLRSMVKATQEEDNLRNMNRSGGHISRSSNGYNHGRSGFSGRSSDRLRFNSRGGGYSAIKNNDHRRGRYDYIAPLSVSYVFSISIPFTRRTRSDRDLQKGIDGNERKRCRGQGWPSRSLLYEWVFLHFKIGCQVYQFSCLPFGLSSAPWAFTKILKPVVAFLRGKGFKLIVYLDDFLLISSSRSQARRDFLFVVELLESLGFVINKTKSSGEPSQSREFLGLLVDSRSLTLSLKKEKVEKMILMCRNLLSQDEVSLHNNLFRRVLGGLGAVCDEYTVQGPWTLEERTFLINLLELIAAFYALQCFTARANRASVLLYLDNSTAVAYINKCGGTRSRRLSSMAEDIIRWCEERDLSLKAVHLAGNLNIIADRHFRRIESQWEMEIDLFAATWNTQLIKFTSWQPQPGAWAVNAFTFSWENLKAYAFPPFNLILRCLAKTRREFADLVLITPYWPSQSSADISVGCSPPSDPDEFPYLYRMETLRRCFQVQGLSKEVAQLLLDGNLLQYDKYPKIYVIRHFKAKRWKRGWWSPTRDSLDEGNLSEQTP